MDKEKLVKFVKLFFYYIAILANIVLFYGLIKFFSCIFDFSQGIIYAIIGILSLLLFISGIIIRQRIKDNTLNIIIYWIIILAIFYGENILATKYCMLPYYGN
jgi:hypothetical protein